jgi:hypothetical protein
MNKFSYLSCQSAEISMRSCNSLMPLEFIDFSISFNISGFTMHSIEKFTGEIKVLLSEGVAQ